MSQSKALLDDDGSARIYDSCSFITSVDLCLVLVLAI